MKKDKKYFCIVGIELDRNNNHCGCCSDTSTLNRLRCFAEQNPDECLEEIVRAHSTVQNLSFRQLLELKNAEDFREVSEKDQTFYYCASLSQRQINFFYRKTDLECYKVFEEVFINDLKEELKKIAGKWNASGKYNGIVFEGRYFITNTDLRDGKFTHSGLILGNIIKMTEN